MQQFLIGNVRGPAGPKGEDGARGLDNYEIYVGEGGTLSRQEWLESITTIVEGESILNRSVVGVSGTMESRELPTVHVRVRFIPEKGNVEWIDSNGVFVVPKSGPYLICVHYGNWISGGNSTTVPWLQLGDYSAYSYVGGRGTSLMVGNITTPIMTSSIMLTEGETISYWIYSSVARAANITVGSYFTITSLSSINLSTLDLYEQWKKQDSSRENLSFDDFTVWISQNGGL